MGPKGGQKGRGHRTNRPNRLLLERSPYLLQHAYNPVDWYPWCDEAFEAARRTDRPVFLSIGYATCHWCHIMAHESFEDPEIADLLNEHFVCIKVDREERPDIDAVYMQVCQMMIGTGGWPLTIVTTPDKRPFFAATYLPKDRRFGLIGLRDVLTTLASAWHERRDELLAMADQVVDALDEAAARLSSGEEVTPDVLHLAYRQISDNYDENFGGFSAAPKFPSPHAIMFLLRRWRRTGDERALRMAEHTLRAMRMGGLFDHVGFGFHRYSTDEQWLVPHFEKMLHDQALLSMAYTEAYLATGREEHSRTVREVFEYVLRDMTSPEGAFYSAEDADSEGEEGRFYLFSNSFL
ncbi:MAG TPA: thioredoxin domain-containing protein [Thermoplasmata archaeon]|nr:thioredoxin domain-containing protein [Thermoplasmata archaeon]